MTAFWDIASYRFITLMMEAVHTSETLVHFNEITWCYIPESCHLHTCHCEDLKSHTGCILITCRPILNLLTCIFSAGCSVCET
jgi:hypothetical protein